MLSSCASNHDYTVVDPAQVLQQKVRSMSLRCYHRNVQLVFSGWDVGEVQYWCEQQAIHELRDRGLIK